MLTLLSPYEVQLELGQFIKTQRQINGFSAKAFAEKTGVPDSTIRKFERTGEISLRQFLLLYAAIGNLKDIQKLTHIEQAPDSIEQVLSSQDALR